ncbi:hypothetical protein HDU67_007406 [Dinochytrium kinnereticum]|nr:hypothetical protein HDU67_007406 [Dinochytrium kinnereticum]
METDIPTKTLESEHDDTDFEEDDEPEYDILPVTEHISLKDHRRTVSAVTVDSAGSRVVSGGRDGSLKMWDFNGMDQRFLPFRTIDLDNNPVITLHCKKSNTYRIDIMQVREVQFSLSGDSFLVATGNSQAKLFDREGGLIQEFVKGDPYLRDLKNTKGHTAALSGCRWHPSDRNVFLTSSLDGTVRIWDINNKRQNTYVIPIKSKDRGGKTAITAACYSADGGFIVCGGQDGEIRVWSSKAPFLRALQSKEKAHIPGNIISSVNMSIDNYSLVTRAFDDTLKLWDIRHFSEPVAVVQDLPNLFEETNAIFSPNDKLVVTGVSNRKGEKTAKLKFFQKSDLSLVHEAPFGDSIVRTMWHGRINQILATSNEGEVRVMYDQKVSASGAKLCADRKAKGKTIEDYATAADESARVILTPHALPMFRDEQTKKTKRQMEKMRNDPHASRKPDFPLQGHGKGGKIGSSSAQTSLKRVLKDTMRDEDPREAILRHAKDAESDPYWVAPAYQKSQPKPVMTENVYEDELEEIRAAKKRRPKVHVYWSKKFSNMEALCRKRRSATSLTTTSLILWILMYAQLEAPPGKPSKARRDTPLTPYLGGANMASISMSDTLPTTITGSVTSISVSVTATTTTTTPVIKVPIEDEDGPVKIPVPTTQPDDDWTATCFQRGSYKDEIIVYSFLVIVSILLVAAVAKPYMDQAIQHNTMFSLVKNILDLRLQYQPNFMSHKIKALKLTEDAKADATIRVRDFDALQKKLESIIECGQSGLHIISDFDMTMTKWFKDRSDVLYKKYYPIEISHTASKTDKFKAMEEWWIKAHELIVELKLTKPDLTTMIQQTPVTFRPELSNVIKRSAEAQIPFLVFSAGLYDIIREILERADLKPPSLHVVSNRMKFDDNDVCIGFHDPLIHVMNKNEAKVEGSPYADTLTGRDQIILMGDSLGDLQMAEGLKPKTLLTIGFLNHDTELFLDQYMAAYDVVIIDDAPMSFTMSILNALE